MKKCFSLILVAILLFTMLPIPTFAAEETVSDRDRLIDLACEVFPEYTSTIRGETTSTYSRHSSAELLFSETRAVSENERILYGQYSNGTAVIIDITDYSSSFDATVDNQTFEQFTGGKNGTASFTVVCSDKTNYPGCYKITNFKYKIYNNTWDMIISQGSITEEECTGNEVLTPNETSVSCATLFCYLSFDGMWSNYPKLGINFVIGVGRNSVTAELN